MLFEKKERYTAEDLLKIMKLLRSPEGCPWDKEQTHSSIRSNFIEETYEVIDAIDADDTDGLREELGDVLLQVVFHAQMEAERGTFTFDDVSDGICKKLIHRHPHIFGDVVAETSEQVLHNWDSIKREEKNQHTTADAMRSVPRGFPALMRAQKVQHKAAKVGFDWNDVYGALSKLSEEAEELLEAVEDGNPREIEEELGDVLFAAVNVSRFVDVQSEEALTRATDKFTERFARVEQLAQERGLDMTSAALEELDTLWDEVKAQMHSKENENSL